MMKREDYRAVKAMDRQHLDTYLRRIWQRGFDAGVKSVTGGLNAPEVVAGSGDAEKAEG